MRERHFERVPYAAHQGKRAKSLVVFTEQKNMTMQNGKLTELEKLAATTLMGNLT